MTFTVRLERADGPPAEPPSIGTTVTNWRTGDTIPLGRERTLRVVGIVARAEDEPPVLIVEDVSERTASRLVRILSRALCCGGSPKTSRRQNVDAPEL
jgi:hypothetical protein